MALENQVITAWQGEDFDINLGPFTDSNGDAIDLTGATSLILVVTTKMGSGTTSISKTLAGGIVIDAGGTFAVASIDGSADTDVLTKGDYWWESKVVLAGAEELQLVAPSPFNLKDSAI